MDPADGRPASRFLSKAECAALLTRVSRNAVGGGETGISLDSQWAGTLRWARNQAATTSDLRTNEIGVGRFLGTVGVQWVSIDMTDNEALEAAVRRAERFSELRSAPVEDLPPLWVDPYVGVPLTPTIWSDATYQLSAEARAAAMVSLIAPAKAAGVLAAGYLQVSATGRAVMSTDRADGLYYPHTQAQYSVTVRDPHSRGSGWAGMDMYDWSKIDGAQLSAIAVDKCLRSRNPVRLEPGRYTTILEPQAVCDLTEIMFTNGTLSRQWAENTAPPVSPYGHGNGDSRLGERMLDERITVTTDPMDPLLGHVPFDLLGSPYTPATWFKSGVLMALSHSRQYALEKLGQDTEGLYTLGAFRMTGGTTSVDEMIATTKRGLLVTRFWNVEVIDFSSLLSTGYTRDGVWLIERGKIAKPVTNFRFTESPLFVLNQVEQLGEPQRVFHPQAPVVVPPMKVRDFSFTSLSDAV
jgi:predicted Zn-dependent protease